MAVSETDSFGEDISYLEKWKSASDGIADSDSDRNSSEGFDCNICLDCVQDPVITLCGHLYCWPCIYKWLNHSTSSDEGPKSPQCPVCKTQVSPSSLVPLYGPGQTTQPSKDNKSHHLGPVIPKRPHGPLWMLDSRRLSNATATVSQPAPQLYHHNYPHHLRESNSIPGSYTSPVLTMDGALRNAIDTRFGVFGEMIYGRIFGNQMTNIYTYSDTYSLEGNSNPRIRRRLMKADEQLNRISFFLLCCVVLCLLLF